MNVFSDSSSKNPISQAKDHIIFIETMGCGDNEMEFDEGSNNSRHLIYDSCHKASQSRLSTVIDSSSLIISKKDGGHPGNN